MAWIPTLVRIPWWSRVRTSSPARNRTSSSFLSLTSKWRTSTSSSPARVTRSFSPIATVFCFPTMATRASNARRRAPDSCRVRLGASGTRQESGARRRAFEARVAIVGKQNTVAIGENDRVTRAGELLVEVRHFDVSERNELEVLFLAGEEVLTRDHHGIRTRVGIQAIFVETAQPGTLHI